MGRWKQHYFLWAGCFRNAYSAVMAVSAMINGGYLLKPYIVKKIRDSEGTVLTKKEPQVVRRVISSATSEEVKRIMELVVTEGSVLTVYIEGYRIGGKTGTAQRLVPTAATSAVNIFYLILVLCPWRTPKLSYILRSMHRRWGHDGVRRFVRRCLEG